MCLQAVKAPRLPALRVWDFWRFVVRGLGCWVFPEISSVLVTRMTVNVYTSHPGRFYIHVWSNLTALIRTQGSRPRENHSVALLWILAP